MADIGMFGPGGEDLAGLFTGQQAAQQANQREADLAQTQANTANTQALTQHHDLANQLAQRTMDSTVDLTNAKNSADQALTAQKLFNTTGDQFGKMSVMLAATPAPARAAQLTQMMKENGVDINSPFAANLLNTAPDKLPDMLSQFSDQFYKHGDAARALGEKYNSALAIADARANALTYSADARANASRDAANTRADAQRDVARMRNAQNAKGVLDMVASGKMTPDKAITYYTMKNAMEGLDENEQKALESLKRHVYNQATLKSPDTAAAVMGNQAPSSPQSRVDQALNSSRVTPNTPDTGDNSDAFNTSSKSQQDAEVAKQLQSRGIPYEPDKYVYRINPATGKIQRAPKS